MTDRDDDQDDPRKDALIAALAAAFALSADAIRQLAVVIYSARVTTYASVYQAIARIVGASLPADWAPADTILAALRDAATAAAQSVAATLATDLSADASRLVNNWLDAHATVAADPLSSLADAQHTLSAQMQAEAMQRAQWKSVQIGQAETAKAQAQATRDAVSDMQDGTLTDANGAPIQAALWQIIVLPADSSGDAACADYAGNTYSLDDADEVLDQFPAHPHCPHQCHLIPADTAA